MSSVVRSAKGFPFEVGYKKLSQWPVALAAYPDGRKSRLDVLRTTNVAL